jgi:hypothetical protein
MSLEASAGIDVDNDSLEFRGDRPNDTADFNPLTVITSTLEFWIGDGTGFGEGTCPRLSHHFLNQRIPV